MSAGTKCLRAPSRALTNGLNDLSCLRASRRTFLTSNPLHETTKRGNATLLTAHRILPYPTYSIFKLIADINSYPQFLPYVANAKVLEDSPRPDSYHNVKWPALASLTVGFQDKISETYTSRVFCVPPIPHKGRAGVGFVEAISGSEGPKPSFRPDEDVSHYDLEQQALPEHTQHGPLAFLRTRWSVGGFPHKPAPPSTEGTHDSKLEPDPKAMEQTNVSLAVEFKFNSPMYEVLGQAASGKVADMMIEAFEKRVREVL